MPTTTDYRGLVTPPSGESPLTDRLRGAALTLVSERNKIGPRPTLIGGSELGTCQRRLVHRKRSGDTQEFTPSVAGRLLAGTALENTIVQVVREVLPDVRNTGARQLQLFWPDAENPVLVVHPDGTSMGEPFDIKTAGSYAFKATVRSGKLKPWYIDQGMLQAGLLGASGSMILLVDRDNLEPAPFLVHFDREHYEALLERAKVLHRLVLDTSLPLPEGEPERAWSCDDCPIRDGCTRGQEPRVERANSTSLPLEVESEIAEIGRRMIEIDRIADPLNQEYKTLADEAKKLLRPVGAGEFEVGSVVATLSAFDRTNFDSKSALAADASLSRFNKTIQVVSLKVKAKEEA